MHLATEFQELMIGISTQNEYDAPSFQRFCDVGNSFDQESVMTNVRVGVKRYWREEDNDRFL
jgi:hypothetical protein